MPPADRPADWSSDDWATPPEIVAAVEVEFGSFDLDPCAREDTAKAPQYYAQADNGLACPWFGKVWLNPPYSDPGPWLAKALEETQSGRADLVVALLPASTDTKWFHDYVLGHAELRFIKGRIRFHGWLGTPIGSPKTPSIYAVYRGGSNGK